MAEFEETVYTTEVIVDAGKIFAYSQVFNRRTYSLNNFETFFHPVHSYYIEPVGSIFLPNNFEKVVRNIAILPTKLI